MSWNEETLRKAAAWQAFKFGRELFQSGAAAEAVVTPAGWKGLVRAGGKSLRITAIVKSPTDIAVSCGCVENRSTGAICGHAVAAALAALAGPAGKPAPSETAGMEQKFSRAMAEKISPRAVVFPPNWREAIRRGQLAVSLAKSARPEPTEGDRLLQGWLAANGAAGTSAQLLLTGPQLADFLQILLAGAEVAVGKDRASIEISDGSRLPLGDPRRENDFLVFPPNPIPGWVKIGEDFWLAGNHFLRRAGDRKLPADLARIAEESVVFGKPAKSSLKQVLESLAGWQEWVEIPESGWLGSLHYVPAEPGFEFLLDGDLDRMRGKLSVRYGAEQFPPGLGHSEILPNVKGSICRVRNFHAEENAVRELEATGWKLTGPLAGELVADGEAVVLRFISQVLPGLRQRWKIIEQPRFQKRRESVVVVEPRIEIFGSGENWLDFDLKFQTSDGISVSTAEVRSMLRAGKRVGRGSGGKTVILSVEAADVIEPLFSDLEISQSNGRFVADSRTGEVIKEIGNRLSKSSPKSDMLDQKMPQVTAQLRPYQQHGFSWIVDRITRHGGALLADDMGLGKTVQTIASIEHLFEGEPEQVVLVVATTSLLGNWESEWRKFAAHRKTRILHGARREQEREKIFGGEVLLTSFGTLARDLAWHLSRGYLAVVVDEASFMRNPDTDHAKALVKLRARHRLALTGTPLENGVRDLWSIFQFVQPGWLGGRAHFRETYEIPLRDEALAGAVLTRLRLKTAPFILRRTKQEVAPELPGKIVIDEFVNLSADQQNVYRKLLEESRRMADQLASGGQAGAARMQVLTALLRLRQASCDLALLGNEQLKQLLASRRSAKLERLLELLHEAISGNHKILVFSQFQKQLLEIEKCVSDAGWRSLRLDGGTTNRQQLVENFQKPDGPPIFLISLKAGGYGLNLTAADTVVHFDPWWNPAAEAQATDRAHRIGQTRPVTVYRMLARGTVEEKVRVLQERKRALAGAMDEAGGGDPGDWSLEDLKSVMG